MVEDVPFWYGITLRNGMKAYVAKSACTVLPEEDPTDTQPPDDHNNPPPVTNPTPLPACQIKDIPADFTNVCPASGSGGIYVDAYVQKNRTHVPCNYTPMTVQQVLELDHLPADVHSHPDGDQQLVFLKQLESTPVVMEGFLVMAKDGGIEGVNCKSDTRLDIHMEIVGNDTEDPIDNRASHVITEVTPWFREDIPNWTTDKLGKFASYVGGYNGAKQGPPTKIRIYGWMFFDEAHAKDGSINNWRGTAWEVHPITRIEVFENGAWKQVQ